ncbi:histidinol phosphatase [Flavobacteriales bacterium]|jgi:protein-tyrosine phosphatase|nr:histidinol phosphatase [Flavobacteriales bacterium]
MFSWFRRKKIILEPVDFSSLKTDIHSHLIPGIDDGAQNLESSVEIIKKLMSLGYSRFITTPHIMNDLYRNTPEIILDGLKKLRAELTRLKIDVQIEAAAEYFVDYDFESKIGKEDFLTFGDKYMLIEFSFLEKPQNIDEIIFKLQLEGYKVVLAHPARYLYLNLDDYKSFVNRGVYLQLNLLSLLGYYSKEVKVNANLLIKNKMVSFIGSDCHNIRHASLYRKCQTEEMWHFLLESKTLLNSNF